MRGDTHALVRRARAARSGRVRGGGARRGGLAAARRRPPDGGFDQARMQRVALRLWERNLFARRMIEMPIAWACSGTACASPPRRAGRGAWLDDSGATR